MDIIYNESNNTFRIYGHCGAGRLRILDVSEYKFSFYIQNYTVDKLKNESDFKFNSAKVCMKKSIYGYQQHPSEFLLVTTNRMNDVRNIMSKIQPNCLFNADRDPVLSFIHNIDITSGWIEVSIPVFYKNSYEVIPVKYCNIRGLNKGEKVGIVDLAVMSIDIECITSDGSSRFPIAKLDPIIQIGVATNDEKKYIFTLNTCDEIDGVEIFSFETEYLMLQSFIAFINETNPDVITGYNIDGFDFPYILERMKNLKIKPTFSRDGSIVNAKKDVFGSKQLGFRDSYQISCNGRLIFDMFTFITKNFKLRSYKLDSVAKAFIGQEKDDVHHSQIRPLFMGSSSDRAVLAKYCVKDAVLPMVLERTLKGLINTMSLGRICNLPPRYIANRGLQVRILSLLFNETRSTEYILPIETPVLVNEKYQGAEVFTPTVGFYNRPVATLDYSSLYPSIMISENLCYSTMVIDPSIIPSNIRTKVSPVGAYFIEKEHLVGVLPLILRKLLSARLEFKVLMKEATTTRDKEIYDGLQNATKVVANSIYGFTGATTSGMTAISISSSVTGYGRATIINTKRMIEEKYNNQVNVIYGDTDSVMIDYKNDSLEEVMKMAKEDAKFITKKLTEPMSLAFEKVYFPYLLLKKKRYAGLFWTRLDKYDKLDVKGLETVRRDSCPFVSNTMKEILNLMMIERKLELVSEKIKTIVSRLKNGEIPINELMQSKKYTKSDYKSSPVHVVVAQRLIKRGDEETVKIGDRVPFLIIEGKSKKISDRAVHPTEYDTKTMKLDVKYYMRHFELPIRRLLENVNEIDLNKCLN